MSVKGMLWALGFAGAAVLAVAWMTDRLPPPRFARVPGVLAAEAPPEASAPAPRLEAAAPPRPADPAPAPTAMAHDQEPPGSEELVSPVSRAFDRPSTPTPQDRAEIAPGPAVMALCAPAGSRCGSSADCCPGLACDGGMAGYGTAGRCE